MNTAALPKLEVGSSVLAPKRIQDLATVTGRHTFIIDDQIHRELSTLPDRGFEKVNYWNMQLSAKHI